MAEFPLQRLLHILYPAQVRPYALSRDYQVRDGISDVCHTSFGCSIALHLYLALRRLQCLGAEWWNTYVRRVLGQVEVAVNINNSTRKLVVLFPRLPYCQFKYHSGSTKEEFVSSIGDHKSQDAKHTHLLLSYPDVEVSAHVDVCPEHVPVHSGASSLC